VRDRSARQGTCRETAVGLRNRLEYVLQPNTAQLNLSVWWKKRSVYQFEYAGTIPGQLAPSGRPYNRPAWRNRRPFCKFGSRLERMEWRSARKVRQSLERMERMERMAPSPSYPAPSAARSEIRNPCCPRASPLPPSSRRHQPPATLTVTGTHAHPCVPVAGARCGAPGPASANCRASCAQGDASL